MPRVRERDRDEVELVVVHIRQELLQIRDAISVPPGDQPSFGHRLAFVDGSCVGTGVVLLRFLPTPQVLTFMAPTASKRMVFPLLVFSFH